MRRAVVAALATAALAAPAVAASGAGGLPARRAVETAMLGSAHADAHDGLRRAARAEQARWRALPAVTQDRILTQRSRLAAAAAQANVPSRDGVWEAAKVATAGGFAINAALLHTGKVLLYGFPYSVPGQGPNAGAATLLDLRTMKASAVDPPAVDVDGDGTIDGPAPLYCSGLSFLPDGRLLVTGGNLRWPAATDRDFVGWRGAFVFDPVTGAWTRQPDMAGGRWYPSNLLLADGRTLVVGGFSDQSPGGVENNAVETFLRGSFEVVPSAARETALYPHLFQLPDGSVALAGPQNTDIGLLNPRTMTWNANIGPNRQRPLASQTRIGSNAVLLPSRAPGGSWKVEQIGGYDPQVPGTTDPSTASTETIDFSRKALAARGWRASAPQNVARSYANTVVLPDASLVTVGGGAGHDEAQGVRYMYPDDRTQRVELLEAGARSWRLGARESEQRGYHSVALLLPDGRVLSAGDDIHPDSNSDTIEIYDPPYLFGAGGRRAARPRITSAPKAVLFGGVLPVRTSGKAVRAVLMASGATTHGADMSQRMVALKLRRKTSNGGLNLVAPASAKVAVAGWYMLFVLNSRGVPSVAKWVQLKASAKRLNPLR